MNDTQFVQQFAAMLRDGALLGDVRDAALEACGGDEDGADALVARASQLAVQPLIVRWRAAMLSADRSIPSTRRLVLLVLATHADAEGNNCYPSQRLLASETQLAQRVVAMHLRAAQDTGWIGRVAVRAGRGWRRHRYEFTIPCANDVSTESTQHDTADAEPSNLGPANDVSMEGNHLADVSTESTQHDERGEYSDDIDVSTQGTLSCPLSCPVTTDDVAKNLSHARAQAHAHTRESAEQVSLPIADSLADHVNQSDTEGAAHSTKRAADPDGRGEAEANTRTAVREVTV